MVQYKIRVKRYYIPLSFKGGLLVSFRRFTTKQERRSRSYRQVILRSRGLAVKEIAIRKTGRLAAQKIVGQQSDRQPKPGYFWLRRQTIGLLLFLAISFVGAIYFSWELKKPTRIDLTGNRTAGQLIKPAQAAVIPPSLPRAVPTHLKIDSVGIDADIVEVGLKPDRTLEVPDNWLVAGWYKYSPTPGELGPSIIDGHVDNVKGLGVFWRLHEMSVGDKIMISRADGRIAKFKVDSIEQYPRDNFPTKKVYGSTGYAGLRLITCGGSFDRSIREYSDNTVVFASLIN